MDTVWAVLKLCQQSREFGGTDSGLGKCSEVAIHQADSLTVSGNWQYRKRPSGEREGGVSLGRSMRATITTGTV